MQARIRNLEGNPREIPVIQRRPRAESLEAGPERCTSRDEAIASAYASGAYSLQDIGRFFGLHYSRVSRIVARERERAKGKT